MHFTMAIAERPKSLGAEPKRKQWYQERVRAQARAHLSNDMLRTDNLYVRIIWFHGEKVQGDTDNIIKPILDALNGVVYADDRQIIKCVSERVDTTKDFTLSEAPASAQVYSELLSLLSDEQIKHVLYVEVGQLASRRIAFGPIDEVGL